MPAFPRGMGGGGYSPNPPGAAYRHHPHRPRPGGAHGLSRRPAGEPEPGLYRASRGGSAGRYAAGAGPGPGADLLIRLRPAAAYRRSEGTGHGDQGRPHPGLRGRPVAPPGGGCDAGERAGFRRRAGQWTDRFESAHRHRRGRGGRRPDRRPDARPRRRRRDRSSRSSTIPRLFRRCAPGRSTSCRPGWGPRPIRPPSSTSAVLQASTTSSVVPLASSGSDSRGDNPLAQHRADPAARIGARRRLAPDLYRSRPWRPRSRDHRHDRHL